MSWKFFKTFLKNPREVGAILPSSSFLAKAMVEGLAMNNPHELTLEFGPGTGVFTKKIHQRLLYKKNYIGIEVNPHFASELLVKFPGLCFINDSAEKAHEIFLRTAPLFDQPQNLRVKNIISGLPFASLPEKIQDGILHSIHEIASPGLVFRTFQYVHGYSLSLAKKFRKKMEHIFGHTPHRKIVFQNIPPAYVLTWTKP